MQIVYKYLKRSLNYKTISFICACCIIIVYFAVCHYSATTSIRITEDVRKTQQVKNMPQESKQDNSVHLVVLFSKANKLLEKKFTTFIQSLFQHASVRVVLHIVGDDVSCEIAKKQVKVLGNQYNYKLNLYDLATIAKPLQEELKIMQKYFSYKDGSYYSGALFFISTVLHRILNLQKVLMIDIDVVFLEDINKLYEHFDKFTSSEIIGIAYEQQPVYRHVFQIHRQENSNTSVGNPAPDGFPGFNSGVLLLNLEAMRNSDVYNRILKMKNVEQISQRYRFKGHLGDQDFFTLIALDFRDLFYVLPCGWNRQLCDWWRHHGYDEIFDKFHACDDVVSLYHGNCNTMIPVQ